MYPLVLCGAFYPETTLKELADSIIGTEKAEEIELSAFMEIFFENVEFENQPKYIEEVVMIHSESVYDAESEIEPGYFIGVPLFAAPENMSVKRLCIDVRSFLESINLLPHDCHPDTVKLFAKIIQVEL